MTQIIPANLTSQMKEDYLAYSMAVLLGRAIPDMYDGLKPVQRRILQTMLEEGLSPDKRYVKCARVTGLTMAYYHPHGGAYGPLVNMATPWSNNVPWIDGHGNFGSSVDGPAAERYTECKLRPSAVDLLLQDKAIWDTNPNYDGSRQEATRFNSAVPTVLLNGDGGIAVGFATRLAPHNLRDVVKAVEAIAKGRKKAPDALIPDFPTGCDIVKDEQLDLYTQTGSGSVRCRARSEQSIQKRDGRAKDRPVVTFTNLPPGVNPEKLGEQVRDALEKGRIENVAEVIDESDLAGDRVSIVAKPGTDVELLAKQLYAYTDLDSRYPAKTLVIDGTRPVELSPTDICQKWYGWRMACLERKFRHELDAKEARLEIVMGFLKAIDKIDSVIKIIRGSASAKEALTTLVTTRTLKFTPDQARAILEMKLRQLTGLDREELEAEQDELKESITLLSLLIKDDTKRSEWLVKQITDLAKRHGNARSSNLIEPPDSLSVAQKTTTRQPAAAKPRFLSVDMKKGVVTQAKGPRGAMVVDSKEKVVLITESGYLRKVAANFKGPIAAGYSAVVLAKREVEVAQRKYLVVFTLEGQLKGVVLNGEDLIRANSKGKSYLPEGATLVHFGEGSYSVPWESKRKKALTVDLTFRAGKPGSKGVKIAQLTEVSL
jgi:DNA gyrase subunit A